MALKLHFAHIRDICEYVKLDATIQKSGAFSIQFCSNHNLTRSLCSIHRTGRTGEKATVSTTSALGA